MIRIYRVGRLEELRPQYQSAIRTMSNAEKVERSIDITEVKFTDGTVLKGNITLRQ